MTDPQGSTWEGESLYALRVHRQMTQEALAAKAGIDRSVLNALEKGRRKLTRHYAVKLAGPLKVKAEDLLSPSAQPESAQHPLALLRRLAEAVDRQQKTIDELEARLESIERVAVSPRRARGDGR